VLIYIPTNKHACHKHSHADHCHGFLSMMQVLND